MAHANHPQQVERRLTAILVADVVEYSRLMSADETGTLTALKAYRRELIDPNIAVHHGRIVKLMGDGMLAEFPSVVDAVQCAVETQVAMQERNAAIPDNRQIRFRMGINSGDVIIDGDDIYGDGVNVAARLQALAEPGSVYISEVVYDQIGSKLTFDYRFLGEYKVKNIAKPVRVYRVCPDLAAGRRAAGHPQWARRLPRLAAAVALLLSAGTATLWYIYREPPPQLSRVEPMAASSAANQPALAEAGLVVLPFNNMSGDTALDYFSDGITEDLTIELSRYPELRVAARNSAFTYKGKPVNVQEVGRDLGIRYVLEGSVRRTADRVRITAQLIDATSGHHVWAERYDEEGTDVFALQDQVTRKVAAALGGERGLIRRAGYLRAWEKPITVLDEYDYFLRIHMLIYQFTRDSMVQAQQVALEGLQRFPGSSLIRIKLGWVYLQFVRNAWSQEPERDLERAFQLASEGLAGRNLPPTGQWHGHWLMSNLQVWHKRDYEQALAERDAALALAPADADTLVQLCEVLLYSDKADDCIGSVEKAMQMGPRHPPWFPGNAGWAYYLKGQYERAIELAAASRPIIAAASYAALNRVETAREIATKVHRGNPKLTLAYIRATQPYRNNEHLERLLDHLRRAGVPES